MSSAKQPLTDYFKMLSSVLNLDPDEYHDGSGKGQSTPNTAFASGNAKTTQPTASANLPRLDAGGVVPPGSSAIVGDGDAPEPGPDAETITNPPGNQPVAVAPNVPPAPQGPQGAVPSMVSAAPPALDLATAQAMQGPQTQLPSAQSRLDMAQHNASYGNPNIINQTVQDLQSEDMNRQSMASNTIQMARNLNSLTQEGFKTQDLAIEAQNNQTLAIAANDKNSALTKFTKAQALDGLNQPMTGADGKPMPIMGPQAMAAAQQFLSDPNTTAFQVLQNPVLKNIPSVAAINTANIDTAVKLQTLANQHITAEASATQASAAQTDAATKARNQNVIENATGISGATPGTPAATNAAPTKPGKYVVEGSGIKLSPAEQSTEEDASKEVATVRDQQADLSDTMNKIQAAQAAVSALPFTGPIAEYAGAGTDAVQKAKAALAGVGLSYAKAFAEDAGARAGGNMMIEQREQDNVGNLGQNKATILNSLQRMAQSIKTKQDYNNQIVTQAKSDPSLESFKYKPLYNEKGWTRMDGSQGTSRYAAKNYNPNDPTTFADVK